MPVRLGLLVVFRGRVYVQMGVGRAAVVLVRVRVQVREHVQCGRLSRARRGG